MDLVEVITESWALMPPAEGEWAKIQLE